MPLVSLYADLFGFTRYIDDAIGKGEISEAVRALHVMREEFQSVVHDDFGGRKVRFIGDCIHALHAVGDSVETDLAASVVDSAKCAGAIRSSFELSKTALRTVDALGLAVGLEVGLTPISKIGIQGDRSVRVASSKATIVSEAVQKDCGHNETRFGPNAVQHAPLALEDLIGLNGSAGALDYDEVNTACAEPPKDSVAAPYARAHTTSDFDGRAHLKAP